MAIKGKSKRQLQKLFQRNESVANVKYFPLGVVMPLQKGNKGKETLFKMHYDIKENIKNNFANLIMTRKGERFGVLDYGIDLEDLYTLMHNEQDEALNKATEAINDALQKFIPSINLVEIYLASFDESNNNSFKEKQKAREMYNSQNIVIQDSRVLKENNKFANQDKVFELFFNYTIPALDNEVQKLSFILNVKTSS